MRDMNCLKIYSNPELMRDTNWTESIAIGVLNMDGRATENRLQNRLRQTREIGKSFWFVVSNPKINDPSRLPAAWQPVTTNTVDGSSRYPLIATYWCVVHERCYAQVPVSFGNPSSFLGAQPQDHSPWGLTQAPPVSLNCVVMTTN